MSSVYFMIPVDWIMNQLFLASKNPESDEWSQQHHAALERMCREVFLKDLCSAVAIHHSLSLEGVHGPYSWIAKSLCNLTILTLLSTRAGRERAGFSHLGGM